MGGCVCGSPVLAPPARFTAGSDSVQMAHEYQTLAAQQMEHSREIHDKIYHRWIDQSVHQGAFESLEASKEINGKNRKKQG
jgi:hypothetical protein